MTTMQFIHFSKCSLIPIVLFLCKCWDFWVRDRKRETEKEAERERKRCQFITSQFRFPLSHILRIRTHVLSIEYAIHTKLHIQRELWMRDSIWMNGWMNSVINDKAQRERKKRKKTFRNEISVEIYKWLRFMTIRWWMKKRLVL